MEWDGSQFGVHVQEASWDLRTRQAMFKPLGTQHERWWGDLSKGRSNMYLKQKLSEASGAVLARGAARQCKECHAEAPAGNNDKNNTTVDATQ